jgi:carbamoyltransferase
MIIVGVSRVHNSAVTLLKDGEIVFHLENERLSNIKYDNYQFLTLGKLPDYVDHVDHIAIAGVGKNVPIECFDDRNVYFTYISRLNKSFFDADVHVHDFWAEHHKMHASCAFYNSGFDKAICIIKDGMGSEYSIDDPRFIKGSYGREMGTTFIASYPANFETIDKHVMVGWECDVVSGNVVINDKFNEGVAYEKTAKAFGFHPLDAGKVMGMSSYGKEDTYKIYENGYANKEYFKFKDRDIRTGYVDYEFSDDFQERANFAYSLQKQTQEKVKTYILQMVEKTGCKNVCLSGGFFLNCVANYEFLKDLPSDIKLYIEPISSDAGTSIGAAKLVWHQETGDMTIRKQEHIYHGLHHSYTHQDVFQKLKTETLKHNVKPSDVAQLIADKNIVAIYQGRSESGPRALGNRSILYDPRDPNGKDRVNKVKNREWFRPFAGTILYEYTNEWFDMRGLEESPFMMYAVDVKKPELIPAITHVDNTCRIQTLKREHNPNYYDLISAFNDITDVPILFNTSFNLAGDCIVETLDDALSTIRRSDIQYLYLPELETLICK